MNPVGTRTGLARDIWLYICREGGRWSPDEIAARFSLPRQQAALAMHNMAGRVGSLRRYKDRGRTRFGVTTECKVPHGVSLAELAAAGAISEPAQ